MAEGTDVGLAVGPAVGEVVGAAEGTGVGLAVGPAVGEVVGAAEGTGVGLAVGPAVGEVVGAAEGTDVAPTWATLHSPPVHSAGAARRRRASSPAVPAFWNARQFVGQGWSGQICGLVMHLSPVASPASLQSGKPAWSTGHVSGLPIGGHAPKVGA